MTSFTESEVSRSEKALFSVFNGMPLNCCKHSSTQQHSDFVLYYNKKLKKNITLLSSPFLYCCKSNQEKPVSVCL